MKYIKKFRSTEAADNYHIVDIPFATAIETNPIQNLVCTKKNKKIVVDEQGNASIVDTGPALITFNVIIIEGIYCYGEYSEPIQVKCEPGMSYSDFVDSKYNDGSYDKCDCCNSDYAGVYFNYIDPCDTDFRYMYTQSDADANNAQILEAGKTYYYWPQGYCLLGDTEVTMKDGSTKQIKDTVIGDEVLSLDLETGEQVIRKVIFTDAAENKSTTVWDEWIFSDGTTLKTAHRHEFFNVEANRFKYMDEWQIGEHILKQDRKTPLLIKHTVNEEVVNHYKITLEGSNNYFANGCLTGDRYCNDIDIKVLKAQ